MNPEHREHRLELSPTQVAGSALAAMTGAFVASWAGTTGTVVGAALASVVVTVGAATYTWSLQRARDAVQGTTTVPWGRLALTSVAVMALGLGGITAIEAVTGKPVSAHTGSTSSSGTTLGDVAGADGGKQEKPAATEDSEPAEPTSPAGPTAPATSTQPTPTTPSPSTAPDPSTGPETPSPDPAPSTSPTAPEPAQP